MGLSTGMPQFDTFRLVKGEDLNHHGTLFAGRSAEWFVESAFVAAAHRVPSENIVCVNIHGMHFSKPVAKGDIIQFTSCLVRAGRTSLTTYTTLRIQDRTEPVVEGFISFVHVDEQGKPIPHNIRVLPQTLEEQALYERSVAL